MKNSTKYTLLGTALIVGSLVFLGAGTAELVRTGTFDGVAGISTGLNVAVVNVGTNRDNTPYVTGGTEDNTPNLTGGAKDNTPDLTNGTNDKTSGCTGLCNPLKSATLEGFLLAILDILLVFAMPIIVLFIMYAGFLYVTAQGDPGKIKTAHSALTWSVVGGVIIFGAKLIIEVIQNTVNAL